MALTTSSLGKYKISYLDAVSTQLVDTVITKQIAALNDQNNNASDLFIGATGKIVMNVGGSNSLGIYNSNASTVVAATNGQALQFLPGDIYSTMVLGSITLTQTPSAQVITTAQPMLNIVTDLQLSGNEVISGDLLTSGAVVSSSMNILRDFTSARVGFGFRVTDNSNLELIKYDNRTNLTKRIALFGGGDGTGSNDTSAFDLAIGSNNYNQISNGLSLAANPWLGVGGSNICYNFAGNVGVQTYNPSSLFTVANSTLPLISNVDPFLVCDASNNPFLKVKKNGYVGIGVASPSNALQVAGNIQASGDISTAGSFLSTSDERVKTDVVSANIDVCYDQIKNLPLRQFKWKEGYAPGLSNQDTIGWIAQEVKEVIPQAVSIMPQAGYEDFHLVDLTMLVKTLYGSVQKLSKKVEDLEAKLESK